MSDPSMNQLAQLTEGNDDITAYPMQFLISFLQQMKEQASSGSVPDSMTTLINQSLEMASGLETYPLDMSTEISSDRKLLIQKIRNTDFDQLYRDGKSGKFRFFKEMSTSVLQGSMLQMLVRMSGATKVLEVGTFMGFGALSMAEALPADGRLVTIEHLPLFADFSRDFFSTTEQKMKIEVQTGRAIELLNVLGERNQQFDFIFIDAAKNEYKDYLTIILDQNILAPKGTVLLDNTIFKGATFMSDFPEPRFAKRGPTIHAFNQFLLSEPRVEQVMLPIADGVTIVRRVGE